MSSFPITLGECTIEFQDPITGDIVSGTGHTLLLCMATTELDAIRDNDTVAINHLVEIFRQFAASINPGPV